MTEHVGRHASHDATETLILPRLTGLDEPEFSPPPAGRGRHASGTSPDQSVPAPAWAAPEAAERLVAAPAADGAPATRPADGQGHSRWEPEPEPAVGTPAAGTPAAGHTPGWPAPSSPGTPAAGHTPGWPAPSSPGTPAAGPSPGWPAPSSPRGRSVKLVWVYPDLLSTYGDRGNLLVLTRRAELRGLEVEAIEVKSDEPVPEHGDIYLLGGGEDLPQILAASRLRADGGLLRAAERGAAVFAVCAGYQLIGRQFGGVEGELVAGLGILDVTSGRGERRGVGEIVADVDAALGVPRLTGFENHQGVTHIGPGARPLAKVALGVGNGDGTEGAYAGHVLGTYLHGPALARNPGLADLLLSWVVGPLQPLRPESEEWARQLRDERLTATAS